MEEKRKNFINAFEQYSDDIFRHCLFRVSDREIAIDLAQDTFAKVWKYLSDGKDVNNLRAFLYAVANNLVIDYYRKNKTVSLPEDEDGEPFDISSFENEDIIEGAEIENMRAHLQELPSQYRDILVMRYIDDLTPGEVATLIGVTENVVHVRTHRAEAKLREKLQIQK